MSANAYDVSVADFAQKVLAASHEVPVIVDFWADWCQPCRILKPILEKLADEYGGRFVLAKVNSDENQELSMRYGVRGIPAVKAFVGGETVDEFTGALPEAKVREFLERLIPSPVEPLRQEAHAARQRGDTAGAAALLEQALALVPQHEATRLDLAELHLGSGAIDAAQAIVDGMEDNARDTQRLTALRARLHLTRNAADGDIAAMTGELAAAPDNLATRLRLANALALKHDYRPACEHLLEIVRRDRKWNDEAGRKTLLAMFSLLAANPDHDELVREFRVALARTLN